jgi:hypothetical protein
MRYGTHRPLSAHAKSSPQHARHLHRDPSVGISPRAAPFLWYTWEGNRGTEPWTLIRT